MIIGFHAKQVLIGRYGIKKMDLFDRGHPDIRMLTKIVVEPGCASLLRTNTYKTWM